MKIKIKRLLILESDSSFRSAIQIIACKRKNKYTRVEFNFPIEINQLQALFNNIFEEIKNSYEKHPKKKRKNKKF